MADKWQKARAGFVLDEAFFASLLLRLNDKQPPGGPDETCETAWTDGKNIGFNPAWIETQTLDEVKTVLAHEVCHIILFHYLRGERLDFDDWNRACDYAVNAILLKAGFRLPQGALYDPAFSDMEAERIYKAIHQNKPKQPQGQGKPKNGKSDPGKMGEVRPLPGSGPGGSATPAEKAEAEQKGKIDLQNAISAARSCGNVPGDMERLVKELCEPVIDWREILQRFVTTQARNDYTWRRPNPRYTAQGLYLPTLQNPEIGQIVFGVDTSGSISQRDLDHVSSELSVALQILPDAAEIPVIFCDHKVAGKQTLTRYGDETLKPRGGGGTRFSPVFEEVEKDDLQPACLIYLTDGYCSDFGPDPEYPVLWILTGKNEGFKPPFGEVAVMNTEKD